MTTLFRNLIDDCDLPGAVIGRLGELLNINSKAVGRRQARSCDRMKHLMGGSGFRATQQLLALRPIFFPVMDRKSWREKSRDYLQNLTARLAPSPVPTQEKNWIAILIAILFDDMLLLFG